MSSPTDVRAQPDRATDQTGRTSQTGSTDDGRRAEGGSPADEAVEETEADACLRPPGSRLLYAIDRAASRPAVAVVLVAADGLWVLASLALHFPTRLETIFQTLVAALTLAMVFVIQHTQAREQVATQRKLDAILLALPKADTSLVALEDAPDSALRTARDRHRDARAEALEVR